MLFRGRAQATAQLLIIHSCSATSRASVILRKRSALIRHHCTRSERRADAATSQAGKQRWLRASDDVAPASRPRAQAFQAFVIDGVTKQLQKDNKAERLPEFIRAAGAYGKGEVDADSFLVTLADLFGEQRSLKLLPSLARLVKNDDRRRSLLKAARGGAVEVLGADSPTVRRRRRGRLEEPSLSRPRRSLLPAGADQRRPRRPRKSRSRRPPRKSLRRGAARKRPRRRRRRAARAAAARRRRRQEEEEKEEEGPPARRKRRKHRRARAGRARAGGRRRQAGSADAGGAVDADADGPRGPDPLHAAAGDARAHGARRPLFIYPCLRSHSRRRRSSRPDIIPSNVRP